MAGARSQEPGARSQEPGARSQEPGARSQGSGSGVRSQESGGSRIQALKKKKNGIFLKLLVFPSKPFSSATSVRCFPRWCLRAHEAAVSTNPPP